MKKSIAIFCILAICILGCNQTEKYYSQLLNSDKLPSQFVTINTGKDTVFVTAKGAVIKIPKGAIVGDAENVQLEIKEAYSMEDIFRAGLTTQSNGQPLSSGGMIYINGANGTKINFNNKINVAIPTKSLNADMKLYKGESDPNGKINWINPDTLPQNPQEQALARGKQIFIANCASCHAINKIITAPPIAHVVKRSKRIAEKEGRNYLYDYTRNNFRVASTSRYYRIINCYSPSAMPTFEQMDDRSLDELYSYIENESERLNLPIDYSMEDCIDSCITYFNVRDSLLGIKSNLVNGLPPMAIPKAVFDTTTIIDTSANSMVASNMRALAIPQLDLVEPLDKQSLYYQFTIESVGWYNIDLLLKENPSMPSSELIVSAKGKYSKLVEFFLVIPSIKLNIPGGPLKNKPDSYVFFEKDGTIPLPQGVKAFIIVLGEYEDKIVFSKTEFITTNKQSFDIELKLLTKEEFNNASSSLQFEDLRFSANEKKNGKALRVLANNLLEAEHLIPSGCNCDCGER